MTMRFPPRAEEEIEDRYAVFEGAVRLWVGGVAAIVDVADVDAGFVEFRFIEIGARARPR